LGSAQGQHFPQLGQCLQHGLTPGFDRTSPFVEGRAAHVVQRRSINGFELKEADVVVRPALNNVGSAAFNERRRSIEAGRQAMLQALPQLREMLALR